MAPPLRGVPCTEPTTGHRTTRAPGPWNPWHVPGLLPEMVLRRKQRAGAPSAPKQLLTWTDRSAAWRCGLLLCAGGTDTARAPASAVRGVHRPGGSQPLLTSTDRSRHWAEPHIPASGWNLAKSRAQRWAWGLGQLHLQGRGRVRKPRLRAQGPRWGAASVSPRASPLLCGIAGDLQLQPHPHWGCLSGWPLLGSFPLQTVLSGEAPSGQSRWLCRQHKTHPGCCQAGSPAPPQAAAGQPASCFPGQSWSLPCLPGSTPALPPQPAWRSCPWCQRGDLSTASAPTQECSGLRRRRWGSFSLEISCGWASTGLGKVSNLARTVLAFGRECGPQWPVAFDVLLGEFTLAWRLQTCRDLGLWVPWRRT
ncbi:uncharacterized protein LOC123817985 [Phyllostomus hastatus]|uniref:uncharacterized protein LOC123817985 n=1 Tax=Phyllostomus hastatus TaxID=9423 RepID=UPI001E68226E|nr:uncharacterized protein LOC123817985 [Phyllostomus hastatus]XP_045693782.1 uncharacterized protein LOC123817985 [Phyllostomus hastatus]